ncbi:hypothetical protein B0A55_13279, partial [Friedmanniomyces simplex]
LWDEQLSGVVGDFEGVKSVNEMDVEGKPSMEKAKAVAEVIQHTRNPIVLLDDAGRQVGFRTVFQMEHAVLEHFSDIRI